MCVCVCVCVCVGLLYIAYTVPRIYVLCIDSTQLYYKIATRFYTSIFTHPINSTPPSQPTLSSPSNPLYQPTPTSYPGPSPIVAAKLMSPKYQLPSADTGGASRVSTPRSDDEDNEAKDADNQVMT